MCSCILCVEEKDGEGGSEGLCERRAGVVRINTYV